MNYSGTEDIAIGRRGKSAPHPWGEQLTPTTYFCHPCWFMGLDKFGSHPYDQPPCDPISRREDSWPRGEE